MDTSTQAHAAHISTPYSMACFETPTHQCHSCSEVQYCALKSMVKFSKQFEGQLVPEWKEAFVDYWQLKKDVKNLQVAAGEGCKEAAPPPSQCEAPVAASHWVMRLPFLNPLGHHKEHGVIQVHKKLASGGSDGVIAGEVYETVVLNAAGFMGTEAEAARVFFERLDEQLNKVNRFYKRKEREFLERGESLRRQLQILVELKAAVTEARRRGDLSAAGSADPEDPSLSCSILHEICINKTLGLNGKETWQTSTLDPANQNQTAGPVHPFHPKIVVRRGVLSTECSEIMQQFFQLRRKKKQRPESPPRAHLSGRHHHPIKFFTKVHHMFGAVFCL